MRIGVAGFLHESNTFSSVPTTLSSFQNSLLMRGADIPAAMAASHHEVGGFFQAIKEAGATAVPLVMARALPSGQIQASAFQSIVNLILEQLQQQLPLDGLLVAPHGATVAESQPDADGFWLQQLRDSLGPEVPIFGTIDSHANLSAAMVAAADVLVGYGTNPHVDQRDRGLEAGRLLVRSLRGEIRPCMAAAFPPMAISIDRQCTDEWPLKPIIEQARQQRQQDAVLSNSIVLGFPYADVAEMGSATIAITDGDPNLAQQCADELACEIWKNRTQLACHAPSIAEALQQCSSLSGRICLLDMGDNVGGGSSADGTTLLAALLQSDLQPVCAAVFDPETVEQCQSLKAGQSAELTIGGKVDQLHGPPLPLTVRIRSFHNGKFSESEVRHGGITEFDQGLSVVCDTQRGDTVLVTSRRMVPFSLRQLTSCDIQPQDYRVLIAKGVNAPIAAYREVCDHFVRVDTPGSTRASMTRLTFKHRRRPMFPFEPEASWPSTPSTS